MSDIQFFVVGAPKQISFVASADSATQTITIPGTVQAGDICVAFDYMETGTLITPSGFTAIVSSSSAFAGITRALRSSYKVLDSGDISGGTITLTNATVDRKMALFFRCDSAISSITVSTPSQETNNVALSPQLVDADTQAPPVIIIGVFTDSAGVGADADVSSSPAFDAEILHASQPNMEAGYALLNAGMADYTVSGSGDNVRTLHSFYLKVN